MLRAMSNRLTECPVSFARVETKPWTMVQWCTVVESADMMAENYLKLTESQPMAFARSKTVEIMYLAVILDPTSQNRHFTAQLEYLKHQSRE